MGVMERLERVLAAIPRTHAGPGGAAAVVKNGETIVRHTWGWADAERRIPFTPQTMFRMCSITKQFTNALLLTLFPDPTVLEEEVRRRIPLLAEKPPSILHLCHNQSGFRDYWATAMLCGSPPEAPFGDAEAQWLIGRTASLQFAPGTRYSYCNQNFRILSDIIEARTGGAYGDLLRKHIFDPAGMPHAVLSADTSTIPGGTVGYEGSVALDFRPAVNRIIWTGDAGLACSLDDMIAWEKHIDATRDDPGAIYSRIAAPVAFADGTPAHYGFGLSRSKLHGRVITNHGGGLRGWRSWRLYAPAERASLVMMFNHFGDLRTAATDLFGALVDAAPDAPVDVPDPGWAGHYMEPETGLAVRIERAERGLRLHFAGHTPDTLAPTAADDFSGGGTRLYRKPDGLRMARASDNLSARLVPVSGEPVSDVEGRFFNPELGATLTCVNSGGVPYAAFSGELGAGEMKPLQPHGPDTWRYPCVRSLDWSPPGDWTLRFRRGDDGRVAGLEVGCWLARHLDFSRI